MHFHIHIAIAVGLFLLAAFRMVMMIVHGFQMFGRFALLAQTIVNPNENLKHNVYFAGQFKKFVDHPALAWRTNLFRFPRAFTEKVRTIFGVRLTFQEPIQPADGFGVAASKQRIHHANQMPYLWLVKCKVHNSDKCNKFLRVLYNCCEHWLPLVSGFVRKLILPDFQCSFYFGETKVIFLSWSGGTDVTLSFINSGYFTLVSPK